MQKGSFSDFLNHSLMCCVSFLFQIIINVKNLCRPLYCIIVSHGRHAVLLKDCMTAVRKSERVTVVWLLLG